MKAIVDVAIKAVDSGYAKCKADVLAVGMCSGGKELKGLAKELDRKLGGAIKQMMGLGDFKAKSGSTATIYTVGKIAAKRVLLVGLGEAKKVDIDVIRKAAACAANQAMNLNAPTVALAIHEGIELDMAEMGRAIGEGFYMGSFKYDEYKTGKDNGRPKKLVAEVMETNAKKLAAIKKGLAIGSIIGDAQSYARTVANRPANVINPPSLAAEAKKLARRTPGLSCQVMDEKQLAAKKMGGILAVGSGSQSKPRFIVLKYSPRNAKGKPVAIVGKAITFDSGGISLKPAADMDEMKLDKTGGVVVLAAMKMVARLKLPITVYGLIPSAENLPSGSSYRPGDIVTTYSGKTVEILNTDAEGRMVLCDAIHYATLQKCGTIIDLATLTGACKVALGKHHAGLMGNDDGLIKALQEAAKASGEKIWHLPSGEEYFDEMKSKIADLKNTGSRWGGASSAAAFLGSFAGDAKWAHLDIAGVDMYESATRFTAVGGSGFGVRLLAAYLMGLTKKGR
jgi:leucyl aminopeptidase